MKRRYLILIGIVVGILLGSYVVYALEYKGDYNVNIKFDLVVSSVLTEVQIMNINVTQEPTTYVDFWDIFKHITPASKGLVGLYLIQITFEDDDHIDVLLNTGVGIEVNSFTPIDINLRGLEEGSGTFLNNCRICPAIHRHPDSYSRN